jgi:hypothetical protein
MSLQCLLLTCDSTVLNITRGAFAAAKIGLELRRDSKSALELVTSRHFEGIVIDCDDVPEASNVILEIRKGRSNKMATIFAIVSATSFDAAYNLGANYVLKKPLAQSRFQEALDIALPKMEREHRRYFRYPVDIPVELHSHTGNVVRVQMLNVSEGGLAVQVPKSAELEGVLTILFELPSVQAKAFNAKVDVAWKGQNAAGLRFLYVTTECREMFGAWLDSLDAQLRYREAMQPEGGNNTQA